MKPAHGTEHASFQGGRRLLIYPLALAVGALAAVFRSGALFALFVLLMLIPLFIKLSRWGGAPRIIRWLLRRRLRPTIDGYVFLAMTVLFGVAAINTGTNPLYLILATLLSLIAMSGVLSELNLKGLKVSRRLPAHVFAGEEVRVHVELKSPRRRLPRFAIEVRERAGPFDLGDPGRPAEGPPVFALKIDPGEKVAPTYPLRVARRGVYKLDGLTLTTPYPFGFFVKYAYADLPAELVVYPVARELRPDLVLAPGAARTGIERRPATPVFFAAQDEFHGLREYRPGDNPRLIHWRSSARLSRLIVKELEPATVRTVAIVVLDPHVPAAIGGAAEREHEHRHEGAPERERTLDRGVTLAASLFEHLARRGERPELATIAPGGTPVRFGGGADSKRGPLQYRMLDCLARMQPIADPGIAWIAETAEAALARGATLYVVTARDPSEVRRAVEGVHAEAEPVVLSYAGRDAAEVEARYYADAGNGGEHGSSTGHGHGRGRKNGNGRGA